MDITRTLFSAIEAVLRPKSLPGGEVEVSGFIEVSKSPGLKAAFIEAPEGTLYIELPSYHIETRALWMALTAAGGEVPMTAITPGEGSGIAVLLSPGHIELYVMEDGPKPGQFCAMFAPPKEGQTPSWSFQSC